jgi:hypothetical protein
MNVWLDLVSPKRTSSWHTKTTLEIGVSQYILSKTFICVAVVLLIKHGELTNDTNIWIAYDEIDPKPRFQLIGAFQTKEKAPQERTKQTLETDQWMKDLYLPYGRTT